MYYQRAAVKVQNPLENLVFTVLMADLYRDVLATASISRLAFPFLLTELKTLFAFSGLILNTPRPLTLCEVSSPKWLLSFCFACGLET